MTNPLALIYDPYLDTLGGGERYVVEAARVFANLGFQVEFAWSDDKVLADISTRFGLDANKFTCRPDIYRFFSERRSLMDRWHLTKQYDLIFWVSDGSIPLLFAKKNLIHLQVPFTNLNRSSLWLKNSFISNYVCNSEFTKKVIDRQVGGGKSAVVYPPIDTEAFKNSVEKDNLILSVGRFDSPSHSKRQDVLIEAFKSFSQSVKNYRLVLVGGVKGSEGEETVNNLKKQAENYPIDIIPNASFEEIIENYRQAKFFWHAAGYDIDEVAHPESVEHFGMSTVEAMAAGAIPIVINKGGQREIITPDCGYLCNSLAELVTFTVNLSSRPDLQQSMSLKAIERSALYDRTEFAKKLASLVV